MAPARAVRQVDDDFVLTISDNDENMPLADEEETEPDSADPPPSRKRKRDAPDSQLTSKKQKKRGAKSQAHEMTNDASDEDHSQYETWADAGEDDGALASDFEFQVGEGQADDFTEFDGWGLTGAVTSPTKAGDKVAVDIDNIIARRRQNGTVPANGISEPDKDAESAEELDGEDTSAFGGFGEEEDETLAEDGFGMGAGDDDEEEDADEGEDESDNGQESDLQLNGDDDGDVSDSGSDAAPVAHPDDFERASSEDEESEVDAEEAKKRAAFFAPEEATNGVKSAQATGSISFQSMNLSRSIMKGLTAVGFSSPTPIQAKTIPVALAAKDVVGGAVTGSGKTAAFVIPILERLLYRPKKVPTTRVVVLMPTRELAVQCYGVARKLASFTDITFALIVGGLSLREQENTLRARPDVVIATPGRFIDHMRNSASFAVDGIEILVLDEADRMLEDGFADELNEILTTIPKSRQTMLFSATMTDSVDKLIRAGLRRPVRLLVDAKRQTVQGLLQEFVRLRPGRDDKRLAYLMWLCEHQYTQRVIVFFRQKKEAHRARVVFGLCGLRAAELHGSMSQEQRLRSVEAFRSGAAAFLLATDLASRGLDIRGVDAVINYEAPQSHEIYLHRVGRTARAGRSGRACTIAAEPDRRIVKAAVKSARAQGAKVVSRVVPPAEADAWAERLTGLEDEIEAVLKEEKEEKALGQAERDVKKGENMVEHEREIMGRPRRTWFESEKDKKAAKERGRAELNAGEGQGGVGVGVKGPKRKLSNKEKKRLNTRDERKEGREWKKRKGDAKSVKAGKKGAVKKGAPGKDDRRASSKGKRRS